MLPEFERALTYLLCTNRNVYARIGPHLDVKAISDKTAVWLIKAANAVAETTGEGPSTALAVIQRLRTWREDGKLSIEAVQAANNYLDDAEDAGLPSVEELVSEVARIIQKREQKNQLRKALDVVAKGGDFAKLGREMAATARIGEDRATLGEMLHADVLDGIVASASLAKFPTGCFELDHILGGGLPKGFTLFLGREKSGKSMVLSSVAAEAIWQGKNVAIATLELDTHKQLSRVIANITCTTIDEVETGAKAVKDRLSYLGTKLGKLSCQKFSPDTPVNEILRWKDRLVDAWGKKVDLLVVDYVDLVGAGKGDSDDAYNGQKVVINTFRDDAMTNGYVVISASQAKRGAGSNKPLDLDDASDSQNKIRIPDCVVAMRMDMDRKDDIDWYLAVKRDGKDRIGTGELPASRAFGRMYPVNRNEPW